MDENFDTDLMGVMGNRVNLDKPPVAQHEKVREPKTETTEEDVDIWALAKMPLLFVVLVCFLAWSANMELVDAIVAVPGMCLCSACFGWTLKQEGK